MFYGRDSELAELNRLYAQNSFQFFVLYGRRRVGKTTLIKEFCRDKDTIFFSAEVSNDKSNLDKFSDLVFTHYNETMIQPFSAWENAFNFIHERQMDNPLILVLDEFPYLADKNPALLSTLQHLIDHKLQHGKIFLILCGSYIGFMEKEVLGSKSPLFGRRTSQLQLKPLNYLESCKFLSGFSFEEQLMFYGALGGTPLYLSRVDADKSFNDNIIDILLRPTSYLYDEPVFLLNEEIQQAGTYNAIIEAIAGGALKANEIATKIGEDSAKCLKYINVLCSLGLLYKEIPFGEKYSSRKTIYGISDNLFRFWYRYVFTNRTLLETDGWKIVLDKKILPNYQTYMGAIFEKVCKEFLLKQNNLGNLPILFTSIGRWWGTDSKTKQQVEIDLIAHDNSDYLICECKWRNEPIDYSIIQTLRYKADAFQKVRNNTWFILFSKSGFTPAVHRAMESEKDLILFDLNSLFILGDNFDCKNIILQKET